MSVLDRLKGLLQSSDKSKRLDVSKRFQLEKQSFSGTMSKFRVAREIKTGRRLGIKFLDEEKTALFNARFKGLNKPSEGEIAIQILHPRIVKTFEFGMTMQNQEYILMEYVDGPGLNSLIRQRDNAMTKNRLNLMRQMVEAVQAVHDSGFIHRDICPRNFICEQDSKSLKLIDFGLTVPDEPGFRQPGNRTGTPQYMAPEIVRRKPTDKRVDIFSLGVTFYRMLTFEHPWGSTDTSGLAALAHDSRPMVSIFKHRPNLNEKIGNAVERCLAIKPDDRMEEAKLFLTAIRGVESEGS